MVLAKETCRSFLQRNVEEHSLERFFPDGQLNEIAENAERKLDLLKALAEGHIEEEELEKHAFALLLLSLYQVHVLLHDTGSMHEGTRIDTIHATVRGIITVDSGIIDKGIRVHYINEEDPSEPVNSAADFESLWTTIAFGLVQVGEDLKARAFLEELMNIPELENHIDVINENDVLENKFRASQGMPEELAGALYLELLVGAIERVRGLY
ncbi:hypothetical protein ACQKWADRAFT_311402 [Trichoderma austrokoningii]